jgi:hypothetical protein
VPHIGKPFRVDVSTGQKQVDSAAQIDHSLNFDFAVQFRFVEVVRRFMPGLGPIAGVVRDKRNRASSRVKFGFGNEFRTRAVSPVAKEYCRERSLAGWDDEIRCDGTAVVRQNLTLSLRVLRLRTAEPVKRSRFGCGESVTCAVLIRQ